MKMSDVFDLPVAPELLDEYAPLPYMKDRENIMLSDVATAHAINQHDYLVEALSSLLNAAESEGLDLIGYKKEIKQSYDALDREK